MVWQQIKILLPSYIGYWILLTMIAFAAWYAWTHIHKTQFKWQVPVVVALVFSLYGAVNTSVNIYQNHQMMVFQEQLRAAQQAQQQQQQQAQVDPVVKMKTEFLKVVEQLITNPAQITPEVKGRLTTEFASLFPTEKEKTAVFQSVSRYYECQRYFWEDAFASFSSKKAIKSADRKACESEGGGFFQREKLFPTEVVKNNDDIINRLSQRQRIPSSDGQEVEVNEKMLRENLDTYVDMTKATKQLFK